MLWSFVSKKCVTLLVGALIYVMDPKDMKMYVESASKAPK